MPFMIVTTTNSRKISASNVPGLIGKFWNCMDGAPQTRREHESDRTRIFDLKQTLRQPHSAERCAGAQPEAGRRPLRRRFGRPTSAMRAADEGSASDSLTTPLRGRRRRVRRDQRMNIEKY